MQQSIHNIQLNQVPHLRHTPTTTATAHLEPVRLIEETRAIPTRTGETHGDPNETAHTIGPLRRIAPQHACIDLMRDRVQRVTILRLMQTGDPLSRTRTLHGHDSQENPEILWQSACLNLRRVGNRPITAAIIGSHIETEEQGHPCTQVIDGEGHRLRLLQITGMCE